MATRVIAAGRREGRQANDWRTFNEKRIKQAKTGLFIPNLYKTEHPGDHECTGILNLESRRDLGAFVRDGPSENSNKFPLGSPHSQTPQARISYGKKRALRRLLPKAMQGGKDPPKNTQKP